MRFPSIAEVAKEVVSVNKFQLMKEDAAEGIDIRLQVYENGSWNLHSGSSDYDQDHRGYWGAGWVPGNNKRIHSQNIAKELIEEAKELFAMENPKASRSSKKTSAKSVTAKDVIKGTF